LEKGKSEALSTSLVSGSQKEEGEEEEMIAMYRIKFIDSTTFKERQPHRKKFKPELCIAIGDWHSFPFPLFSPSSPQAFHFTS
jgi:hypothetical protein